MYKALKVLLHYSLMPKTTFLVFECHIDLIELKLCLSGAQMIFTRLCFVCQFGKKQTLFCSVANLFLLHEKYSQGHLLATGRAGKSSKAGKKCGDQYMHAVSTGFAFKSLDIWTIRYVVRGIPHTHSCGVRLMKTSQQSHTQWEWEWSRSKDVCGTLLCSVFRAPLAGRGCSSQQLLITAAVCPPASPLICPSITCLSDRQTASSLTEGPQSGGDLSLPSVVAQDVREAGKKNLRFFDLFSGIPCIKWGTDVGPCHGVWRCVRFC